MINQVGFSTEALAFLADVDEETIARWSVDGEEAGLPHFLDDARAIADHLIERNEAEPSLVGPWFSVPNRNLGGASPIVAIRMNRFEDVLEAGRHDAARLKI